MENMEIRFIGMEHEPHEYEGLVFNMPRADIPLRLAREVARVGSMELWQYQSFVHHEHPWMGDEDGMKEELALVEEWKQMLSTRFPQHQFVIEVTPMDRATWFQATESAPKEDDAEFVGYQPPIAVNMADLKELFEAAGKDMAKFNELRNESFAKRTSRKGSVGSCEKCGSSGGFGEPYLAADHRGIQFIQCLACGEELIHSTKTIRFLVGGSSHL